MPEPSDKVVPWETRAGRRRELKLRETVGFVKAPAIFARNAAFWRSVGWSKGSFCLQTFAI